MKPLKFFLTISLFCFWLISTKAQTIQADVFIVGNTNAAVAAAIQAAQSNVKTVLLLQAEGFDISEINNSNPSGIEAAFLRKMKIRKAVDTAKSTVSDKLLANEVLWKWTDSLKAKLTVIKKADWIKASRSGKNWVFKLANKQTIKPEIFINVANNKLDNALKINPSNFGNWTKLTSEHLGYKTSVASQSLSQENQYLSLYDLLDTTQENLVYLKDATSMAAGQAAGGIAAFSGFFNSNTSKTNLRKVQAELLNFKAALIPFVDVSTDEKTWKSIQMLALCNILKPTQIGASCFFYPDSTVSIAEIKAPMKAHFYKAQIWFDDNQHEPLSLAKLIDLLCYVGNKAKASTQSEIEKKWRNQYGFRTDFDLNKLVNRREFAALLIDYCSPFVVSIDKQGNIQR